MAITNTAAGTWNQRARRANSSTVPACRPMGSISAIAATPAAAMARLRLARSLRRRSQAIRCTPDSAMQAPAIRCQMSSIQFIARRGLETVGSLAVGNHRSASGPSRQPRSQRHWDRTPGSMSKSFQA